ncbi:MAG: hypothetical protein B6I25_06100 [Planctomycetales bacterium 4572_13]|nr:MAG: hypothetical protein B6I25_06100 [Planctomycetales bacterium 4572_13]
MRCRRTPYKFTASDSVAAMFFCLVQIQKKIGVGAIFFDKSPKKTPHSYRQTEVEGFIKVCFGIRFAPERIVYYALSK